MTIAAVIVCLFPSEVSAQNAQKKRLGNAVPGAKVTPRHSESPGRWHPFRGAEQGPELTAEQRQQIEQLEAMGYLSGSVERSGPSGVVQYTPERAWTGLNLYNSGHTPQAVLMDMQGRVLHEWERSATAVWPERRLPPSAKGTQHWRRVYLYPNGDLLAIFEGLGIVKLDKESRVIWANYCGAHHDIEVMPNGHIYVLTRSAHLVPSVNERSPILEDYVTLLDGAGKELERVSLLECFENSGYREFWRMSGKKRGDLFHTNSLEVLDGRIADCVPQFAAGNLLTSMLVLNAIAVVNLEEREVVWATRGVFKRQHDPQVLPNGNLMLFDNRGMRMQSRIIEFEPDRMSIAWQYGGVPATQFYSYSCGTCQRLPNGNTLITESDNGRAFEITYEGETVWEFVNPNRAGAEEQFIATLFEVKRLGPEFPVDWARTGPERGAVTPQERPSPTSPRHPGTLP